MTGWILALLGMTLLGIMHNNVTDEPGNDLDRTLDFNEGEHTITPMGSLTDAGEAATKAGTHWDVTLSEGNDKLTITDGWRPPVAGVTVEVDAQGGNDIIDAIHTRAAVTLHGGAGDDALRGGLGADRLEGGTGADTLYAGKGDTLLGGADADIFKVSESGALLDGGQGNDVFQLSAGGATLSANITDFDPAQDRIEIFGAGDAVLSDATITETDTGSHVVMVINGTSHSFDLAGVHGLTRDNLRLVGSDNVSASVLVGTPQGDTFTGSGPVAFATGAGNDSVSFDRAGFWARGSTGDGDDVVHVTGNSHETLTGTQFSDVIDTGTGNDHVTLGPNSDPIGYSQVTTGAGHDTIVSASQMKLDAGDGNDSIDSSQAPLDPDRLLNDPRHAGTTIHAGAGADTLHIAATQDVWLGTDADADVLRLDMGTAPAAQETTIHDIRDNDRVTVHYAATQQDLKITVSQDGVISVDSEAGALTLTYAGPLPLRDASGNVIAANLAKVIGVNSPDKIINLVIPGA